MIDWTVVKRCALPWFLGLVALGCGGQGPATETTPAPTPSLLGRWNVTIEDPAGPYPSWFELEEKSGAFSGRFVGRSGSARPLAEVRIEDGQLRINLPIQHEDRTDDLVFSGRLKGDRLVGETYTEEGAKVAFVAHRAPALSSTRPPSWGEPVELIQADLSNWAPRDPEEPNGWTLEEGLLVSTPPSVDLVSLRKFRDFRLHLEFLMPKIPGDDGNSGVYLRGRYEVQIQNDHDKEADSLLCGGVYGFITPSKMACKPQGEWNTYEMTLIGRQLTVVLNGETIIDDAEIPGITGGALDSHEAETGPLMLQGDHRGIHYRNIVVTPAVTPES